MTFRVVRSLDETRWQRFAAAAGGNIFHTPEMFEVFRRARRHDPELWAVLDGDDVVALLPTVRVSLLGGMFSPWTTRSIAYGGLLAPAGDRRAEAVRHLLDVYQRRTRIPLFTEIRNAEDTTAVRPVLEQSGLAYEPHLNFLIPLDRPAEAVMAAFGKRAREQIRRGLRRGLVRIAEVEARGELEQWYATLQQTYRHAGLPLADRSLFEAAFDVLRPKGMIKLLIATVDGVPAACSAELLYRDQIYAWYAGTDRSFSPLVPNELLMWHILEWGATNGYRVYDFGGAGKPGEPYGVRDFKAKFGGDLVEPGRYVMPHGRVRLALSSLGYRAYRRLASARRAA